MKSVLSGGMYVGKDTAHEIYGDNFYENRAVNFVQPFSKKWRSHFFDSLERHGHRAMSLFIWQTS